MTHAIDCDLDEDCICGWTTDLTPAVDRTPVPDVEPGDLVHFVLDNGPRKGELRPAFVVRPVDSAPPGVLRLCILADDTLDGVRYSGPTYLDVEHCRDRKLGTWHVPG
ncbi:MAG: hypothetical protein ACYSUI_10805 [Planctomycetota bacterium]|jgi:hypothetical protein